MTKSEQTLNELATVIYPDWDGDYFLKNDALQAMKQHAVEFVQWYETLDYGDWINKTTEELYDKFNNPKP